MAQYKVMRDVYSRYNGGGLQINSFNANNDVEAVLKVLQNCNCYAYSDKNLNEFGDKDFIMPSLEEVTDYLSSNNGDGSDFIYRIENVTTKKVIFEDGDLEDADTEEDW